MPWARVKRFLGQCLAVLFVLFIWAQGLRLCAHVGEETVLGRLAVASIAAGMLWLGGRFWRSDVLSGPNTALLHSTPMRRGHAWLRNAGNHWAAHFTYWVLGPALAWLLVLAGVGPLRPGLHALINATLFVYLTVMVSMHEHVVGHRRWTGFLFMLRHPFRSVYAWVIVGVVVSVAVGVDAGRAESLLQPFLDAGDARAEALLASGLPWQLVLFAVNPLTVVYLDDVGCASSAAQWAASGVLVALLLYCAAGIRRYSRTPARDVETDGAGVLLGFAGGDEEEAAEDVEVISGVPTWQGDQWGIDDGPRAYRSDLSPEDAIAHHEEGRALRDREDVPGSIDFLLPRRGWGYPVWTLALWGLWFACKRYDVVFIVPAMVTAFTVYLGLAFRALGSREIISLCTTVPVHWTAYLRTRMVPGVGGMLLGNVILMILFRTLTGATLAEEYCLFFSLCAIWLHGYVTFLLTVLSAGGRGWLRYINYALLVAAWGAFLVVSGLMLAAGYEGDRGGDGQTSLLLGAPILALPLSAALAWWELRRVGGAIMGYVGIGPRPDEV